MKCKLRWNNGNCFLKEIVGCSFFVKKIKSWFIISRKKTNEIKSISWLARILQSYVLKQMYTYEKMSTNHLKSVETQNIAFTLFSKKSTA